MKTTDKIIIGSGLLFGILFYEQDFGVNFFIFSLVQALGLLFTTDPEKKTKNWWLVFTGVNISALSILLYGSLLGVWANIISLFVLASISIQPKSSLVISLFHSLYTVMTGIVHVMTDFIQKTMDQSGWTNKSRLLKNTVITLVSFVIALIFIGLYRNANVAFKDLTNQIDLSFISAEWIIFTLFGYYLVYLMYKPRNIAKIQNHDLESSNEADEEGRGIASKWMSMQSEITWARTLLIMLNVVLVVVLSTEFLYELGGFQLSEEIGHSENVHKGVNALIFSIVLAVGIILFFFQGRLNFIQENKWLKNLALVWIVQNVLLVILTAWKNWLYVEEFFLTYKRIGVFVYLVCCMVGLAYTYLKVTHAKSNWFLVRKVGWTIYAVLFLTPLVNWDRLIIEYNFTRAETEASNLDVDYLLDLPQENYPLVFQKLEKFKVIFPEQWDQRYDLLHSFYEEASDRDWRSFNFRTYSALIHKSNHNEISYSY